MCTLILASRVWPELPLLVAANRDEALDRAAGPPRRYSLKDRTVLAPLDQVAGGTWLGLNDRRLFVGITNRFGLPKDPGRRSRGRLVEEALSFGSAAEAHRGLAHLQAAEENGFHLVLADAQEAFLLVNDGAQIHRRPLSPGFHVITERSFDAGPTQRPQTITKALATFGATPPDDATWEALLAHHDPDGFEGVCVHVNDLGYGTRSSTLLRVDAAGDFRFRFADGPPCRTPFTAVSGS